ncbi:MAG: 30S ribosome-binding factor RbfA [Nitrospiria bacterium]
MPYQNEGYKRGSGYASPNAGFGGIGGFHNVKSHRPPSIHRSERVGDQIRAEIADIISTKIKDPRVGFVTVTSVILTDDLKHAKIFVSASMDGSCEESLHSLFHASGFIKKELGKRLQLRYIPELTFKLENDSSSSVLELLEKIKKEDEPECEENHG